MSHLRNCDPAQGNSGPGGPLPTTPLVDPYRVVNRTLDELARQGHTGPYGGRAFAEAATLAAGLLAALGGEPAVSGDTCHPHVLEGLALLDVYRASRRADTGSASC